MAQLEPLTSLEEGALPSIIEIITNIQGKSNSKTNKEICNEIFELNRISISDVRFRAIIRHIRVNNLIPFLASSSKGYYIENDKTEMFKYILSLEERAEAIKATALALRKQLI